MRSGPAARFLVEINTQKSPHAKLQCLLNCCKAVFEIITETDKSDGAPKAAGADEFLPLLIYIVIKSGAMRLFANLRYIEGMSEERTELCGEAAYYFTNLYSALSFVRDLKASDLHLTQEEFDTKRAAILESL